MARGGACANRKKDPRRFPPVTFVADPRPHVLEDVSGSKGTALVFMATECPISKRYIPEIAAVNRLYFSQGVKVVVVYSNAGTTAQEATKQVGMGPLRGLPVLMDGEQKLADAVGATLTPEVAVLDADFVLRYRGRIDNGFAARGKDRTAGASSGELRDVLEALVAGKPVKVASAPAIGCAIERAKIVAMGAAGATNGPTYATDIAPILQKNCISCHRDNEVAPMRLISYSDAKRWATNMAEVTGTRFMPPWKPVEDNGRFVGERRLTDAEIATLKKWAEAGAPPGDLTKTPAPPKFQYGWKLGKPDLVLKMPEAWRLDPRGKDVYRCFVLPTNLTEDKKVVAVEYRAGNAQAVHHILGFIDTQGRARKRDEADSGPGYYSFGGPGFAADGELGGWAPGMTPEFLPDGIARSLPAGADVVMQVHYHGGDSHVGEDVSQIGLYFAKKPVEKRLRVFPVDIHPLEIAAGKADYRVTRTVTVPIDANLIWVAPHMHLLGKTFEMTATLPDGTEKPLIEIADWDFRWQGLYTFRQPVKLPKGSKITITATYDNTANNPRNPNNPPKEVTWGEETTDEMCIGFVGFVAANENDPLIPLLDGLRRQAKKMAPTLPQ